MKRFSKKWIVLTIGVLILVSTLWRHWSRVNAQNKQKEKTFTITHKTIRKTLTISGKIDADEKATLRFQSSGRLIWVGVKEGDTVKKYQAIAQLDARDVQKALEKVLRDYSKQRNDFEETWRVTYSGRSNPADALTDTAKRILEKNQWDLEKAVLDVELKKLAVDYATLITPIAGVVTQVAVPYAGINITPAQAEFSLINPSSLYLSVLADQTEVTHLSGSSSAEIIFDAYPGEKITGTVKSVGFTPKAGESTTVYEAKVLYPLDGSSKYRVGMTADATFLLGEKPDVIVIPPKAMKKEKDQHFVTRVIGTKRQKTPITAGDDTEEGTEVLSGLTDGDIIVY
ncbi:efflux RND transporter periplasmic adaptor subunit [Candidatus Gottesmanbacteria bacterium]|nr:efflux RND transporter periplasmic adaptor subunit [Candidatus Gottesmanbacteria bacterium]